MAKELVFKLWNKRHLTISCLLPLAPFFTLISVCYYQDIFPLIVCVSVYENFGLSTHPHTLENFLMHLVLWLRVLATKVSMDLAGLLPPLLPCYITGFQSL